MIVAAKPTYYTMQEFLALPDHKGYELIDGEPVEINVSNLSSWVAARIVVKLGSYCENAKIGSVFGADAYYRCFPERPDHGRKPDASFIRKDRMPPDWLEDGYFTIPPDLAVEVLSPNDLAYDVQAKIREYLDAGVLLIWEINPEERLVLIHRADGTVTKLKESGQLSGETIVTGFSCLVADLFPS